MKNEPENKYVAQGVAAWQEKEAHASIMQELSNVHGFVDSYVMINGNYYYWAVKTLNGQRAIEIAKRENHDEIMYMIHQYGKSICPSEKRSWLQSVKEPVLPDEVQVIIATRNEPDEMSAFLQYWGFDSAGQNVVLERKNHDELLNYVNLHGFKPDQQHKLYSYGFADVFDLHIKKHGLCASLLDEIFEKLTAGKTEEFYHFINLHELPVTHQLKMVQLTASPEFKAYVDKYGLWNEVHGHIMEYRSMADVLYYISKHRFLEANAERIFAVRASSEGRKLYLQVKAGDKIPFIQHLLRVRPLDYDTLTEAFLNIDISGYANQEDITLMRHGSHEAVMARVCDKRKMLSKHAFVALFFRNNQEEFEACLNNNNYCLY